MAEPSSYALSLIHGAANRRSSFGPTTARRAFTVGMTGIGEIYFLPSPMEALAREAPGVTMRTVRNPDEHLRDDMEAGRIDLALGLLPKLKAGFSQRRLFRQRYVCMFRKGHRFDKRKVSLAEFSSAEHVVVAKGTGHGRVDELLERSGISRSVRLTVPHFVSIGHIPHKSDMVAHRSGAACPGTRGSVRADLCRPSRHPAGQPAEKPNRKGPR